MAIPVILGPAEWDIVQGVNSRVRLKTSGHPTSFGFDFFPPSLQFDTTTGEIHGKAKLIGTSVSTLTATNSDGTSAPFQITIVVSGGGGGIGTGGITVYQSKYWSDDTERIDYADLDSAGHSIAVFDTASIGAAQLTVTAVADAVTFTGGAGLIGQYTFTEDAFIVDLPRLTQKITDVSTPGVAQGDVVVVNPALLNGAIITPDFIFYGQVARNNLTSIYVFNMWDGTGGPTTLIPAGSIIDFRVFSWPT